MKLTYEGILVKQRGPDSEISLFCSAGPATELLQWAKVERTIEQPGAAQRMLSDTHVRRIENYLKASIRNTIPTVVTISLEKGFEVEHLKMKGFDREEAGWKSRLQLARLTIIDPAEGPGSVIDGQHRLHALRHAEDKELPVFFSVILGADRLEKALQFVVINNTAKKVPPDLVKAILSELSEDESEQFQERLKSVGMTLGKYSDALKILDETDESPFKNLIDWDANRVGNRVIKPAALEASLRAVLSNLETPTPIELDDALQLLLAIWIGVVDTWKEKSPWYESNLGGKAAIVAVTEYLVERLNFQAEETVFDLTSFEETKNYCSSVFNTVCSGLWTKKWDQKGLDTSAGRELIKTAIGDVRRAVKRKEENPLEHVSSLNLKED